jgi:predicted dienelactone hydrolase
MKAEDSWAKRVGGPSDWSARLP